MKPLDDFLPFILPHVPGYAVPTSQQVLVQAAIEFCDRTSVIQEISEQIARAGVAVYDVDVPNQQVLVRVQEVLYDGRPLDVVSYPVAELQDGRPTFVMMPLPAQPDFTIIPAPAPDHVATMAVRAAFKPTPDADQLHDDLYTQWLDAVVQGALRRMYSMPGQPFTSMTNAQIAGAAFEKHVCDARLVASRKRLVSSMRVRPRPLA